MYCGKYVSHRRYRKNKKLTALLVSVTLILGIGIGSTVAYLLDNTGAVTNTFTPANVSVDVEETFQNNTKTDVDIRNNSNIKVYIRATIVVYWKKGNDIVAPPANGSVGITMGTSQKWIYKNGIYYYTEALEPNAETDNLIEKVSVELPKGYTYHLDVHAEAIQADGLGADSAQDAWAKAKAKEVQS